MRALFLATGCLLLASLGWLVLFARPQPAATAAEAPTERPAAAAVTPAPAPALRSQPSSHPPPVLPVANGRERFLDSAADKWQRVVDGGAIAPDRAARGWEIIRRYREAVYPQLVATSRQHERAPATTPAEEVAYLRALYYGPAVDAARRRALEELAEVVPPASLGQLRKVEPSLFPEEEIAAVDDD